MENRADSFNEEFEVIRIQYGIKLAKQIRNITTQWQLLQKCFSKRELLDDIYRNIHKISGSAGIFGYGAIGSIATDVEQQLKPIMDNSLALSVHDKDVMSRQFESLMAEVENLMRRIDGTIEP